MLTTWVAGPLRGTTIGKVSVPRNESNPFRGWKIIQGYQKQLQVNWIISRSEKWLSSPPQAHGTWGSREESSCTLSHLQSSLYLYIRECFSTSSSRHQNPRSWSTGSLKASLRCFIGQEAHRDFEGEEETKKVVHHLPWIVLLGTNIYLSKGTFEKKNEVNFSQTHTLQNFQSARHRSYGIRAIWVPAMFWPFCFRLLCKEMLWCFKKKLKQKMLNPLINGNPSLCIPEENSKESSTNATPAVSTVSVAWKINGDSISKSAGFLGIHRSWICRISKHRL